MRHRAGRSSLGFDIGRFLVSEFIASKSRSLWRIGNNISECTLCGRCESICNSKAISVSVPNKTWTLNNYRCNQCLACLMACPKRCLTQVKL